MSWSSGIRAALTIAVALGAPAGVAHALEGEALAAVGDGHFRQLHGFDALEAYQACKGRACADYVVARRWQDGAPSVVLDVRAPADFDKWAVLMFPRPRGPDDVFVYVPWLLRERRVSSLMLEWPVFELITLGEIRPIVPGELRYRLLGEVRVYGEPCHLIEGRPRYGGLGFDRVELAVSLESGFSLRTRYFRNGREFRRVLIYPGDLRGFDGRVLPARRRILVRDQDRSTVVRLHNVLPDPALPRGFFSQHNLRAQRFPTF